ncbi:MAG: ABC transporter ATP-binding protein [Woeseiaceae bacterium]
MSSQTSRQLMSCSDISVSVPGRLLVENLNLELQRGELIAVLGQNGAGKTLSLLSLAGLRALETGRVQIGASDIHMRSRGEVARQLALLPQDVEDIFPTTVIDTTLIGRHPHIGRLRWEGAEDYAIAERALQTVGLADLAQRDILTLSGGERRRVAIAQILSQQPDIYLLDEPTNHLDPQHQLDTMRIFRNAADNGAGVIATLHDVNLAVRFADRCLLLFGDGRWELGPSAEVLNENRLSDLFATPMESVSWRSHNLFVAGNP